MRLKFNIKSLLFFQILAGVVLVAALGWLYWPVLSRLILNIAESEDYSYGLLLPLVSAYVVYLKWPLLRRRAWQQSWLGLLIIASGLSLLIVGELAAELYTTRFSFVVVLTGLCWLLGGWELVRLLSFPLILLLLMLPLPELVTNKLTLPLQLISSSAAAWILQALGVPVLRQGNIIDLGVRQLQVVAACSGLRYILSLLALGMIYCYFFQRRAWKSTVLLLAVIPAAIMVNALRVVAMALVPALLHGFWHVFSGWLIFLLCFAFLALINRTLNSLWPDEILVRSESASHETPAFASQRENLWPYLLGALVLVLLAIPIMHHLGESPPIPLRQSFDNFPLRLGPWEGKHSFIDPAEVELTRSQAHLNADYQNPDCGTVNLWIAYYESQKKAGGFVHSPKGCLTASGWKIEESRVIEIAPGRPVNLLLVERMGTRMVVFYWFLQRGRWLASEYLNKFYMGYDGLWRRRTDGALVRLITPAGSDVESAKRRLISFSHLLVPVLPQFIPD
jgi:exosortase D (VPLPA-CTERM-specific)